MSVFTDRSTTRLDHLITIENLIKGLVIKEFHLLIRDTEVGTYSGIHRSLNTSVPFRFQWFHYFKVFSDSFLQLYK